jgi:hypothetical protein
MDSIPWDQIASDGGAVLLLVALGYRWLQSIAAKLERIETCLSSVESRLTVIEAFNGLPAPRIEPSSPAAAAVDAPDLGGG